MVHNTTHGLTRFFRNASQLKTFEYFVIPEILKKKERETDSVMRIWSAGCSTGEEPYTIAVLCKELLPADYRLEILASDSNREAIRKAERGIYSESAAADIPGRYLRRYFRHTSRGYRVRDDVREPVTFLHGDLRAASGLTAQDIVFFRNVSMYYADSVQRSMLEMLWKSMDVDSYLFLGESESIFGLDTGYEFVHTDWSTLFRKRGL